MFLSGGNHGGQEVNWIKDTVSKDVGKIRETMVIEDEIYAKVDDTIAVYIGSSK